MVEPLPILLAHSVTNPCLRAGPNGRTPWNRDSTRDPLLQQQGFTTGNLNTYIVEIRVVGGREGIRTPDPLLAKQVLSQLSYTPTVGTTYILKHFRKFQNPFLRFSSITVPKLYQSPQFLVLL
jgi:hypothetical protein